jgi:mRNA interferase RelE/StbE
MSDSKGYELEFTESAQEDLRQLDAKNGKRIFNKLNWLAANAEDVNHTALTGQWSGYYRYRIGDYRAIYELDAKGRLLIVAVIGHRREVYDE